MSNFDFIATYVDLSDIPTYTTNITLEGQLLKISFVWNERIGKRTIFISNSADICYLQNTILHPNESFELNSNAIFDDLPYKVVLQKVGDTNKVGNIYKWSKDFILCFYRTVDIETEKLNVKYGVTAPSTPILPPSNGGGDNGGNDIPSNETHFTTMSGSIKYLGVVGDVITLSDGTVYDVDDANFLSFSLPAGEHRVTFTRNRGHSAVGILGDALTEVHNFPSIPEISWVRFGNSASGYITGSPNLIKVPDTLPTNITYLSYMFIGATSINQDISSWNMGHVTNMATMFYNATAFNQDISGWDVSSVTSMNGMFWSATAFNSDISNWNTSKVTDMSTMFYDAPAFNQDLSGWCVSLIPTKPNFFDGLATAWTLPRPVWGTCPA